jgi:hypothetical protein
VPEWSVAGARPWLVAARRSSRSAEQRAAWTFSLRAALASRALVWIAGLIGLAVFGRNAHEFAAFDAARVTAPFQSAVANFLFAPAARWDSVWYLTIAHSGYTSAQSSAMFPLYPLLIHVGALMFGSELVVGLAISLASLLAAFYLLYRLIELELDEPTARLTLVLLALCPMSLFFSAVYTESLYLALSVGAIYAGRLDRWAWAGILGALAAATRSAGVLIVVPLALMYWMPRRRLDSSAAWLALVPAGLLAYLAYYGLSHGQPLAPFNAEAYWGRQFAGPFGALVGAIAALPHDLSSVIGGTAGPLAPGDPLSWNAHELIDLGLLAFTVVGLAGAWRRLPFAYFAYGFVLLAQATSYPVAAEPLKSVARYMLVIFPAFVGWALLLKDRPRLRFTVLAMSAAALVFFSGLWALWDWVA